ncbi:MAG: hypothetical protein ABIZ81_09090 [Opitutaceae bacterium]
MNFADIENMWRSPQNQPTAAQLVEIKMKFVTDLKQRHRGNVAFLTAVGVALAAFIGKIIFDLIARAPELDRIDLGREWAIIPFLTLPVIGWVILVRQYRRHRAQHPNYDRSINASVRALLDENRVERARYKTVSWLQAVTLVVLPLIVFQLRAVGKAGDEILIPAFVIFPIIIIAIFAWSTFRYHRQLLPRKRELEALLASYS